MNIPGDWPLSADAGRPSDWTDALYGRLFQQRTVVAAAQLNEESASDLVAQLMTLDATGDEPISLRIANWTGTLGAALSVIDVIDSLGVPVHATATGLVEGPPMAVLATCAHRWVSAHSRMKLCGEELSFNGPARLVESWLCEQNERLMALAGCIARSSSKHADEVLEDLKANRYLSASEAIRYGLADEILATDARVLPFRSNVDRPTVGFRPTTS